MTVWQAVARFSRYMANTLTPSRCGHVAGAVCPAGNLSAAAAFAVAFLGDVLDVAAHVVVVTGLMHTHFQVRRCDVAERE
jgi:hypothetical protein